MVGVLKMPRKYEFVLQFETPVGVKAAPMVTGLHETPPFVER